MKKLLLILTVVLVAVACNNGDGADTSKDPNETHPVSETIPDSLKLVNDSAIVPDVTPGNGSGGTNDDSAARQPGSR